MDVGVRLHQYEVVEHIGRGGMADVWSARDTSLGRMVAIKTIAPDLSAEQNPLLLFEREARTIASLEHPHILPVYGFGQFQGKLYIVMRYITGGSLEDVLKRQTMSFDYALKVCRSIAEALYHAHTENVVHLDLKPANILLDSKGVPYLADFGLATALGADGRARNPGAGTLLYMAPEQMTSEQIDHRADIYSFAIVIHHVFTGELPFSGSVPLSLKQLQFQERLPYLGDLNPDLPDRLTDVLRQATALSPENRYDTVLDLISDVESALGVQANVVGGTTPGSTAFADLLTDFDPAGVQLREAEDIYDRAHQAWAGGNGRFLLSITHFMVMSDFYSNPEQHGLEIDRDGLGMLLRGALEYDYNLDYWWDVQPDNDSRRWVCLHTIRSETAGARERAYARLRRLPDADPPRIPIQVAQALALENNEDAALAGIGVLSERVQFVQSILAYRDNTATRRNGIIETVVRDGLQITTRAEWHPFTYSPEIDERVAEMALNGMTDRVRALAARTVGRMGSLAAVNYLVEAHHKGHPGTTRAFAYILDEAPSLPSNVPVNVRLIAWLRNTARRLTEQPMGIVWAFAAALLGGSVGMGQHIYRIFRSQAVFDQQRILNTFAVGLLFGFFVAILTVVAKTLPERLRGFWPNWTRFVWSTVSGYYLSQLIWWAYVWLLLNLDSPPKDILILTGIGTAIGFVVPAMVKMRGWAAFLLTVVTTYAVHYIGVSHYYGGGLLGMRFPWVSYGGSFPFMRFEWLTFTENSWIFAYAEQSQTWTILLPLVVLMALGVHFPALLADIRALLPSRAPRNVQSVSPSVPQDDGPRTVLSVDLPEVSRRAGVYSAIENSVEDDRYTVNLPGTGTLDPEKASDVVVDFGASTEEYEMDRVGGYHEESNVLPAEEDDEVDWDAIMSPLEARTEEYELGAVGGRNTPSASDGDTESSDDDDDQSPNDELEPEDVPDDSDQYKQTTLGVMDPSLASGKDDTLEAEDVPDDGDQYKQTTLGVMDPSLADNQPEDDADPEQYKNTMLGPDVQKQLGSDRHSRTKTHPLEEVVNWEKIEKSESSAPPPIEPKNEKFADWNNITETFDKTQESPQVNDAEDNIEDDEH